MLICSNPFSEDPTKVPLKQELSAATINNMMAPQAGKAMTLWPGTAMMYNNQYTGQKISQQDSLTTGNGHHTSENKAHTRPHVL